MDASLFHLIEPAAAGLAAPGAGLLLAAAQLERRDAPERAACGTALMGALLLLAAAAVRVLGFGRPQLLLGALSRPESALFWEIAFTTLAAALTLLYAGLLARGTDYRAARGAVFAAAAAALGLVIAQSAGSVMSWRAAWSTWTLVLPVLGLVLPAAAAALGAAESFFEKLPPAASSGRGLMLRAIGVSILLWASYPAALLLGSPQAQDAAKHLFSGSAFTWTAAAAGFGWAAPLLLSKIFENSASSTAARRLSGIAALLSVGAAAFITRGEILALGRAVWSFFAR